MTQLASRLAIFSILVNIAIMFTAMFVTNIDGTQIFTPENRGGVIGQDVDVYGDSFLSDLQQDIQPLGGVESSENLIYRIMDLMSLGFIYKFFKAIDSFLYGFVNLLSNFFGHYMAPNVRFFLFGDTIQFGALKFIISISYILYGIKLFTGKEVVEEGVA